MRKKLEKLFKRNFFRNRYQTLINQINALENDLQILTDNELREKNFKLQKQYIFERDLNRLISPAFALTREASIRTLGLRHFDVQLLGGLVLNDGKVGEMKTGEGKTLVATLPAFLNSIPQKGVHIITVNNYLANRDQVTMGQIYRFLGLNTGLIQEKMSATEKKENYNADITYVTNYDVAFDFLRDNLALDLSEVVLRPFNYCIIDEVDSVLIDEAQTPLIIAKNESTVVEKHVTAGAIIEYLTLNTHYVVDEKNKYVRLTESGDRRIEQLLNIQDLYDIRNPWVPYILNALAANTLYFNNVHYILQNNRIVIVDEFTGRIMPNRRWSNGLHEAMEVKEKLPIRQKSFPAAAITYQNFFSLYPKLSGMTGTGKTVEKELQKIYKLAVKKIPTNRPNQRKDLPDFIFKNQFLKWNAIAKTCQVLYLKGQPVLIGTKTVEKSEMLAQLLNEYKLSYQILNAKPDNVRKEAEIVAQAGKKNSITIATNMAGRGTDIVLGGSTEFKVQKKLYEILTRSRMSQFSENSPTLFFQKQLKGSSQKFWSVLLSLLKDSEFRKLSDVKILQILRENDRILMPTVFYQCSIRFLVDELSFYYRKQQKQENKIVKNLGGLYILGTERNDSRRVDDQLRGRSGRQGDPGTSRFFLSLDDTLLRLFGSSAFERFIQTKTLNDIPLESKLLTKSLDSAQAKIEERAYRQRKNLFDYDDIISKQRNLVYRQRKIVLKSRYVLTILLGLGEQAFSELVKDLRTENGKLVWNIYRAEHLFGKKLSIRYKSADGLSLKNLTPREISSCLWRQFWLSYNFKRHEAKMKGVKNFDNVIRIVLLSTIDQVWQEYLEEMTLVKDAVGWRGYAQSIPLTEYKKESFELFEKKNKLFRYMAIFNLFRSFIL